MQLAWFQLAVPSYSFEYKSDRSNHMITVTNIFDLLWYRIMAQNANTSAADQVAAISQGAAQNVNVSAAAQASSIFQGLVNEENSSASIAALSSLQRAPHTIVGLTRTQCVAVAAYEYENPCTLRTCNGTPLKNGSSLQERSNSTEEDSLYQLLRRRRFRPYHYG